MNKYIDAERLIHDLEERIYAYSEGYADGDNYRKDAIETLLKDVRYQCSLQQKQPESICSRCVYRNKTDDACEYPYGGRDCFINENGVYKCNGFEEVAQQEQRETDGDDGKFVKISVRKEFAEQLQKLYNEIQTEQSSFIRAINQQEHPEIDLKKFTEKMDAWKARYSYPDNISIKATMAFTARMFYQYPNVARQWYESLPKATMD